MVIRKAYDSGNIRLYTIKVHALRTSARIIGAASLSELAEKLEEAGEHRDMELINNETEKLLSEYEAFKETLAAIRQQNDKK